MRCLQDQAAASGLGPALLHIVISALASSMSLRLTKVSDALNLRGKVLLLHDRIRMQRYLSRLKQWVESDKTKFNRDKFGAFHLGWTA